MMPMAALQEASKMTTHKVPAEAVNYKKKYKALKRKMRMLVYEQECFMEELRKAQRKLLKVSRDRSFLLDRLLQHEKPDESTSDSEATASSDSDNEGKDGTPKKRKLQPPVMQTQGGVASHATFTVAGSTAVLPGNVASKQPASWVLQMSQGKETSPDAGAAGKKKVAKITKKSPKIVTASRIKIKDASRPPGHMTREELEHHLEMKQSTKPQFMSLEKTPYSLPDDIFSHDNSNQEGGLPFSRETLMLVKKEEEEEHLIIDMPQ